MGGLGCWGEETERDVNFLWHRAVDGILIQDRVSCLHGGVLSRQPRLKSVNFDPLLCFWLGGS